MIWPPLLLSLQVTAVATTCLFVIGLGLALLLTRYRLPGQTLLETAINLPLVLPPSGSCRRQTGPRSRSWWASAPRK